MYVAAVFEPTGTMLLLAWLPGVVSLARELLPAGDSRLDRAALIAVLALSLALSTVHLTALLLGDFRLGLVVGLSASGALGYLVAWKRRAGPGAPRGPGEWRILGFALFALVLVLPAIVRFNFHDETLYLGHLSMTSAIENGPYPPRHLTFPDLPLRYHYGFDLLAAMVARLLGLRTDVAIDVSTASLALLTILAAAPAVRRIAAGPVPPHLLLLALFAGGLPFLAPEDGPMCSSAALCEVQSMKWVGTTFLNPPLSSNFFQHPFTLGLPLTLAVLAIALTSEEQRTDRWRGGAGLGLILATLSLSNAVLFIGLVPALAVLYVAPSLRGDHGARTRLLATLVAAAAAPVYGGFFLLGASAGVNTIVTAEGGIAGGLEPTIIWHLASFGLALPLGLMGIRRLIQGRALIGLLVLGCLLVLNLFRYQYSWDIVKFATAAHLYLALASIETLRALGAQPGRTPRIAAWVAWAITLGFGVAYVVPFWGSSRLPHHPALEGSGRYAGLTDDDTAALDWLRAHAGVGQLVYRARPQSLRWAQLGGLPQVWTDIGTEGFVSAERITRRGELLRGLTCEGLVQEDVRWVVIGPEDGATHRQLLQQLTSKGATVLRQSFGAVDIYERVGDQCPAAGAR